MKATSIILGMFLLPSLSLEARVEAPRPQESRVIATGATGLAAPILRLTNIKSHADGSIEFQVDSTGPFKVLIESSADLKDWTGEGLWEPNAPIVITNRNLLGAQRFYRADDYSLRVQGTVRDIRTKIPVGQANVTFHHGIQYFVTQTDAQGVFRGVVSKELPFRTITVEKAGYDLLATELLIDWTNPTFQTSLWLAPSGYRPPNDDFQDRFTIEGTNVTVQTSTFAATSEPGHALDIWFDDYGGSYSRNLWWTWTAPMDGAVRMEISDGAGAAVYTGGSLQELVEVWDTGMDAHADNPFLVKQGVQYHIAFGTVWPAEATGFTLRMVPPEAPVLYVGGAVKPFKVVGEILSLGVRANGPWPMSFQWRKDGVDIPNGTNASFFKWSVELQDAGAYSVAVANEVGTTISDEIHVIVIEKRPTAQEMLQGTWTQETPQGPLLVTFANGEFTAKKTSDNTSAGSGHYTISESSNPYRYYLVMTYTEPLPEVVRYLSFELFSPDTGVYQEWDKSWTKPHFDEIGTFTRAPQP